MALAKREVAEMHVARAVTRHVFLP
uniref:Uncharacterized protein n=1 Tax=Anguilla anguilla TaxID=7936 RepID=A0A0E9RV73_ANGAN